MTEQKLSTDLKGAVGDNSHRDVSTLFERSSTMATLETPEFVARGTKIFYRRLTVGGSYEEVLVIDEANPAGADPSYVLMLDAYMRQRIDAQHWEGLYRRLWLSYEAIEDRMHRMGQAGATAFTRIEDLEAALVRKGLEADHWRSVARGRGLKIANLMVHVRNMATQEKLIDDLYKELAKLEDKVADSASIATYNHRQHLAYERNMKGQSAINACYLRQRLADLEARNRQLELENSELKKRPTLQSYREIFWTRTPIRYYNELLNKNRKLEDENQKLRRNQATPLWEAIVYVISNLVGYAIAGALVIMLLIAAFLAFAMWDSNQNRYYPTSERGAITAPRGPYDNLPRETLPPIDLDNLSETARDYLDITPTTTPDPYASPTHVPTGSPDLAATPTPVDSSIPAGQVADVKPLGETLPNDLPWGKPIISLDTLRKQMTWMIDSNSFYDAGYTDSGSLVVVTNPSVGCSWTEWNNGPVFPGFDVYWLQAVATEDGTSNTKVVGAYVTLDERCAAKQPVIYPWVKANGASRAQ